MPTIADANIPYMVTNGWEDWDDEKKTFKLSPNSTFLTEIEKQLAKAGYKNVYTVVDGYEGDSAKDGEMKGQRIVNGWKNSHHPWSYKLDKAKMCLTM